LFVRNATKLPLVPLTVAEQTLGSLDCGANHWPMVTLAINSMRKNSNQHRTAEGTGLSVARRSTTSCRWVHCTTTIAT